MCAHLRVQAEKAQAQNDKANKVKFNNRLILVKGYVGFSVLFLPLQLFISKKLFPSKKSNLRKSYLKCPPSEKLLRWRSKERHTSRFHLD